MYVANTGIVTGVIGAILAAALLFGIPACSQQAERESKNMTVCVESGGSWVTGNCISPDEGD